MLRISAFLFALGLAFSPRADASTTIPGGFLTTQTWTKNNSPYYVQGDITIPPGATLTIQPGVFVLFNSGDLQASGLDAARIEVTVQGALNVNGTTADPVTMRALFGTNPSTWYGIVVASTATGASLTHVTLQHSSNGVRIAGPTNGIVTLTDVALDLNNFDLWTVGGGLPTLAGRIDAGRINGNLTVQSGAILALNRTLGQVQGDFSLIGALEAKFLSPENYEQLQVQGAVTLSGSPNLDVSGLLAAIGDQFTLIDNQNSLPVNGTFAGLPQGSQFNVGRYRFQITYAGGTGNDVVLTVLDTYTTCDLVVEKSGPAGASLSAGGIQYNITVRNFGAAIATGIVVQDSLPTNLRYVSAIPSQGTCVEAGGRITCSLGDLVPGGSASIALGTSFDFDTLIVINTVVATSQVQDSNPANNTASAVTKVYGSTTGVGEVQPESGRMRPVRIGPNPASQNTRVFFAARPGGIAEVRIFDAAGRHVRTLKGVVGDGGAAQIVWDGRTEAGTTASSGVFHYQVVVDGQTIGSERAVLVR